jgi:uncharacterized RDD family membrane protein YckC
MTDAELDPYADGSLPSWAQVVPPDARSFQGHRAGFITRFIAASADFAVVLLILGMMYAGWAILLFIINPGTFSLPSVSLALVLGAAGLLSWLFFTAAWATTGRTFGAKMMGIRVVSFEGKVMRLPGAAIRSAFCLVFLPGLFWVIVSHQNRSLQDTVLRTSVIYDWTKRAPAKEAKSPHGKHDESSDA